ncbi:MAG TPA: hypothetical protein PLE43_08915 [Alphaproteobacteria bacterium]|nr:hypothetical protein [Alphaproteobacteria bacterium]HRK98579.1 hypothetical protein [Alphaproteobacteria bacterium]
MATTQINKALQRMYHLRGQSHDAANQLYQRIYKLQDLPKLTPEQLLQIKAALDLKPVITVDYSEIDFPRAYRVTPSIAVIHISNREPDFYMLTPTGYNGEFAQPTDAILLTGEKENMVSNCLFLGGHSSPTFVISGFKKGVVIPDDYSDTRSLHTTAQGNFMADFNFFARKENPNLWEEGRLLSSNLSRSFFVVEGRHYLAINKDVPEHTPVGYIPVSHKFFVWKFWDEFDRAIGVEPPPMPTPLAEEYENLKMRIGEQECKPS